MSSPRLFSYSSLESWPGAGAGCNAYKNIPVRVKDLRLQGFSWLDRYFVELSLVFGLVNSVEGFVNLGELVLSLACFLRTLTHRTLDDVPVVSPKESGLTDKFSAVYKKLCSDLRIELAPDCSNNDKAFNNQTRRTVLGFSFNSSPLSSSFSRFVKADNLTRKISWFLQERQQTSLQFKKQQVALRIL